MFLGGKSRKRSTRRSKSGCGYKGIIRKAALPGTLFALNQLLGKKKRHHTRKHKGTRKGMRRKTARRAFMRRRR